MKNIILQFEKLYDKAWLKEHILNLYNIEKYQTSPAHIKAAEYVYNLLCNEGFESELVNIPADGKTSYQDKTTPIGWDVSDMYLKLTEPIDGIEDCILADYKTNHCSAAKHSTSTPPEGVTAKLVTEDAMNNGADVSGAFVLLNPQKRPQGKLLTNLLDRGAIGYATDYNENYGEAPEHTAWLNSGTETNSWNVQANERDFIGFLISQKKAEALRDALAKKDISVYAFSNARRYETVQPFVSALLPGKDKKEIWVMAHMYEPLIDDNANGVIGSVAMLKALRQLAQAGSIDLKYSVRVVFASEVYGFAAAAEYYGGDLSERCLAGINMDGLPASLEKGKHRSWRAHEAPEICGDASNIFLHQVMDGAKELHPEYTFLVSPASYGDDQALSDFTVGLPTVWFLRGGYKCFHHNSILSADYLDIDVFVDILALSSAWVCAMASFGREDVSKMLRSSVERACEYLKSRTTESIRPGSSNAKRWNFLYKREFNRILSLKRWSDGGDIDFAAQFLSCPGTECPVAECDTKWYNEAGNYVYKRKQRGLPLDMTLIPEKDKQYYRGLFIYYPIANLLSHMDGKKTLRDIIDEYDWIKGSVLPDEKIAEYIEICKVLCRYGYLEAVDRKEN